MYRIVESVQTCSKLILNSPLEILWSSWDVKGLHLLLSGRGCQRDGGWCQDMGHYTCGTHLCSGLSWDQRDWALHLWHTPVFWVIMGLKRQGITPVEHLCSGLSVVLVDTLLILYEMAKQSVCTKPPPLVCGCRKPSFQRPQEPCVWFIIQQRIYNQCSSKIL